jgi:hypothetical protein
MKATSLYVGAGTLTRVRLPWRLGGQAVPAIEDVADAALVATWASTAVWASEVHQPFAIIDVNKSTRDVHIQAAWDRVQSRGVGVQAELPQNLNDFAGTQYPHLHSKISAATDDIAFKTLYDKLKPRGAPTQAAAAQLLSVSGPGGTDWHAQCPYAPYLAIPRALLSTLIRLELYLPHPQMMQDGEVVNNKCSSCPAHVTEAHGHHAVCCKHNNEYGSRTAWHNEIRDQVIAIAKDAGLTTTAKCSGLQGPDERAAREDDRTSDRVADLNIKGLKGERERHCYMGVLGDISTSHPIRGTAPYTPTARAATEVGASAKDREEKKMAKYADMAARRDFGFEPMCVETYGRMGNSFLDVLWEIAEHEVTRNIAHLYYGMNADAAELRERILKTKITRKHRQYIRRISVVRARGLAHRVKSEFLGRSRAQLASVGPRGGTVAERWGRWHT